MYSYLSENLQFFKGSIFNITPKELKFHKLPSFRSSMLVGVLFVTNHGSISLQRHMLTRQNVSIGVSKDSLYFPKHSCRQRLHSFWSAPRVMSSGPLQHQKSVIRGLHVESGKSDWLRMWILCACSENWVRLEVAILAADQKEHRFLGWECFQNWK